MAWLLKLKYDKKIYVQAIKYRYVNQTIKNNLYFIVR